MRHLCSIIAQLMMEAPVLTPAANGNTYLLDDFGSIEVHFDDGASTWHMIFNITDDHNNTKQIVEIYSPVNDRINILDIRELMRPYFDLSDHLGLLGFNSIGLTSLPNSRKVQLQVVMDCVSEPQNIGDWGVIDLNEIYGDNDYQCGTFYMTYTNAPSGFRHTGTGEGGIGSMFLSRYSFKTLTASQPCAVSFFGHGETLKITLLHYVDGIPQEKVLNRVAADNNNMHVFNFTLQALATAAEIDVKNVICVNMELFLNSAPMDKICFMHEPKHRPFERIFAFIGAMGQPEFVALTGTEQRDAEFEGVFLMEHNDYRKADTSLRRIHTSYTGPLNEGERDTIWDMAASPWVYVIENGQLREVTITEVELTDSSPHREPIGYNVKWRYTNELVQRTFSRLPNVEEVEVISNDDTIHGLE